MIESYIRLNDQLIMYSKRLIHPDEWKFPFFFQRYVKIKRRKASHFSCNKIICGETNDHHRLYMICTPTGSL